MPKAPGSSPARLSLQCSPRPARADLHSVTPRPLRAARAGSTRHPAGSRGPEISGRPGRTPAGHLGISAMDEGAGVLARGLGGPRATGCGTLAGDLRPARCACDCARRRQPPRPVPPSGHGAHPQPPQQRPRPHAPGHAERQTAAPGRPRAGRGRAAGPAAHWPSAVLGAGRRARRASALRQAEAGAGRRDPLLAGRGGGGRALRDGSTEGRSQARRRAPRPELGFCRWARHWEPRLRSLSGGTIDLALRERGAFASRRGREGGAWARRKFASSEGQRR